MSGNQCAFPNCKEKIVDNQRNILGETCHIEAANFGGERYNPSQTDEERAAFENLILLCKKHHVITNDVNVYTVDVLKKMKSKHEVEFQDNQYSVSDETINNAVEYYNNLYQINTNSANGQQINTNTGNITINQGLTFENAVSLFQVLFENNFPRLRAVAEEAAKTNVEELTKTFWDKANNQLTEEEIEVFSNPDFQFILTKALETAARKDSKELRENLTNLLLNRIKNDKQDIEVILFNEAIDRIGRLTTNQLKIITLFFLMDEYTRYINISSWTELNMYFNNKVKPFLSFENVELDFRHIDYCGCANFEPRTIDWRINYTTLLEKRFSFLFDKSEFMNDILSKQFNIDKQFKENIDIGTSLLDSWSRTYLHSLYLTSVGIVIALTYYETLMKEPL